MKRVYKKPTLERRGRLTPITAAKAVSGRIIAPSDSRLKTNVVCIGLANCGLPLYRYSYLGSSAVFEGVMAQDVLSFRPSAVSIGETGFYEVDYKQLDLRLQRVA